MGRTRPTVAPVRFSRTSMSSVSQPREARRSAHRVPARPAPTMTAWRGARARAPRLAVAHAREHLALGAEAFALLDAEAGAGERRAHAAGHRPGGERRARGREPRELAHHLGRPHLGIPGGREAVEEERVGARLELRQQLARVARHQRELHAPAVELQAVEAGDRGRPHGEERRRERPQLLERREGLGEVAARRRDGARPTRSAAARGRRGSSRRASQAARKLSPSPKPVSRMVNVSRPRQRSGSAFPARKTWRAWARPAVGGMVDVLELRRVGHALGRALEPRGGDADGSAGHARHDTAADRRARRARSALVEQSPRGGA